MKILVVLPNWLGDALMATPAIEYLAARHPEAKFTFVGSFVSIEALKHHPRCEKFYIDKTKEKGSRFLNTYRFAKKLGRFDLAVSFRNQLHASLLLRWTGAPICCARSSWHSRLLLTHTPNISTDQHLVLQYLQIAACNADEKPADAQPLKLYIQKHRFDKETLGINAGATYGSAKRWYPERFAQVAAHFSDRFDIVIFGGPNEVEMAKDIEKELKRLGIKNYTNLAGKTSIQELCAYIGGCSLFVTNDSGPMHVACSYQVPTVAVFGPTRYKETSQWKNEKSRIVRHEMDCSPCMKRECPLGHHNCMKEITADEVIDAVKSLHI
ncbi:lipopolysaccharide heptosyltransferase II [Sulfurimonas sp. HSL-1716]|uniref:lipopolysaccharide heptosyltransferase II n=1 Tax=Hydrocurvibacter sulfurireducens TaxID=3131937 RepID=UPI0031F91C0F